MSTTHAEPHDLTDNPEFDIANHNFQHSYQQDIDDSYLAYDKLMFYNSENLFTFKCPVPSIMDYFKINLNFTQAYDIQQN